MSQALSEEEFHRMQAQLLELRTQNYKLSDDLRKSTTELTSLRQKNAVLERDFIKAQKLCTQIEQLEQENQGLKEAAAAGGGATDGELVRLQAENATLQKKMKALQDRVDRELQSASTVGAASAEGPGAPAAAGTRGETAARFGPELEMALSTEQEEKRLLKEQMQHLETSKQAESTRLQEEIVKLGEKLKKKQESFQRLQAEKEVLYNDSRTKIDEINQRKEEELASLRSLIQKLQADMVAANQTSAQLKEDLQNQEKEQEVALQNLREQASKQSAVSQERVDIILQENDALRTNLAALEQIQTAKTQEMNLLREQQEALAAELSQRRAECEALSAQRDDLGSQLQESSFANRKLLEQLTEEGLEKDRLLLELEEAKKTAEKRKAMLDEMAIQLNQEKSNHKEALSDLKLQHEKEILGVRARYEKELRGLHEDKNRSEEEIRQQLREEKARTKELEALQPRVEELQAHILSMEGTKGWFERRLKEAEEKIEQKSLEHQDNIEKLQNEHQLQVAEKQSEMERLTEQLLEVEKQKDEHNNTIGKLRQEIKDTVDGQRILEKKGSSALKDLKRQLQLERKRADKLQERLQEILTNTLTTRTGLEELVLSEISSPSRSQPTGDSSSISSFSYKDMMKETQTTNQSKSGGGSPQSQRPADLSDDEVGELFQRLAEVQQQKWMLEEKVKHLEVSCSSMAEDICRKSAIIETYVMDSRIDVSGCAAGGHGASQGDRGGLGSVLRDLVKPGDENLREMNKKLQNMLEEQLTKNMHLQKDLELLSQELVRLSKEGAGPTDPCSHVRPAS
uniref:GRIP1 associated protein 1 n=1 Tax=Tetraodon nigroviridis TaxID=99883 RepID=H3CE16_TETNG